MDIELLLIMACFWILIDAIIDISKSTKTIKDDIDLINFRNNIVKNERKYFK